MLRILYTRERIKMENLKLGDVEIKDDVEKGLSAFISGKRVMWLNQKSEVELLNWLAEKHGRTFESNVTTTEANRKGWKNVDNPPRGTEKKANE